MLSHVILTARATPRCPTADARLPTRGPRVGSILLSNPRPCKFPFGRHRDGQSCRCRCVWRHTFGTRRWRSVTRSRGIIDVVSGDESGDDVRGRWVAPHSLTHGVCMVLCAEHRSDEFQCLREGHVFASELSGMRRAAGVRATCHRSGAHHAPASLRAASGDDEGAWRILFVAVASCRGTATVRGG